MAIVGLLDAFRVLLIGPIFDQVLNPGAPPQNITLFQRFPGLQHAVYLQQLMPKYWHNPLSVVAAALVGATIIKGLCDYVGTYLVSYAGYGLVTDLRNDLYQRILKRSASFFSHYPTGKLVSTLANILGPIYAVAHHPKEKLVASAGFDGIVYLHNPDNGQLVREFVAVPLGTKN